MHQPLPELALECLHHVRDRLRQALPGAMIARPRVRGEKTLPALFVCVAVPPVLGGAARGVAGGPEKVRSG